MTMPATSPFDTSDMLFALLLVPVTAVVVVTPAVAPLLRRKTDGAPADVATASAATETPVFAFTATKNLESAEGSDAATSAVESVVAPAQMMALELSAWNVALDDAYARGTTTSKAMVATRTPSPTAAARRRSAGALELSDVRVIHETGDSVVPSYTAADAHESSGAAAFTAAVRPSSTSCPAVLSRTLTSRILLAHAATLAQPIAASALAPAAAAAPHRSCAATTELSAVLAGTLAPTVIFHVTMADGMGVVVAVGVTAAEGDVATDADGLKDVDADCVAARKPVVVRVALPPPPSDAVPDTETDGDGEKEMLALPDADPTTRPPLCVGECVRDAGAVKDSDCDADALGVTERDPECDGVLEPDREPVTVADRERESVGDIDGERDMVGDTDPDRDKDGLPDGDTDVDSLADSVTDVDMERDADADRDGDSVVETVADTDRDREPDGLNVGLAVPESDTLPDAVPVDVFVAVVVAVELVVAVVVELAVELAVELVVPVAVAVVVELAVELVVPVAVADELAVHDTSTHKLPAHRLDAQSASAVQLLPSADSNFRGGTAAPAAPRSPPTRSAAPALSNATRAAA